MNLSDALKMIDPGRPLSRKPVVWADLGCGSGLFTQALAGLLPAGSEIYALDRSWQNIGNGSENKVNISFIQADFEKDDLNLPQLDGILMANSLHYVENKNIFLRKMKTLIRHTGKFLIIEYDTTLANPWIPFPVSYDQLKELFRDTGFNRIIKLGEKLSSFGNKTMYSCLIEE